MDKLVLEENELAQFKAEFENTGNIGLSAAFIVDLSKETERFDLLKTEPVFVPPGKKAQFALDKRFAEGGEYSAKGYVSYGIYNSDAIELTFKVGGLNILYVVVALILATMLIAFGMVVFRRKKRTSTNDLTNQNN